MDPEQIIALLMVCIINYHLSVISHPKYMRTNIPGVFCGGDVATFPLTMAKNQPVNIGHWQMAQAHGRIVK